jgi:copper oxidase (laccase) domain-containing protein
MKHTKQYPGYSPKEFFYGFIGKDLPTKNNFFFEPKDAQAHKKQLAQEIGTSETSFCFLKQVHSDKCFIVKDREFLLEDHIGDALATNLRNITLTIQTADCVPVLFFDTIKKKCSYCAFRLERSDRRNITKYS